MKVSFHHQLGAEDTTLADALLANIRAAKQVDVGVAWISEGPLLDAVQAAHRRGARVRLAFGLQHNIPRPEVVESIRKAFPRGAVKVRRSGAGIFHPKVYLCSAKKGAVLWVGSMNATRAGFRSNWESAARSTLGDDDGALVEVKRFLTSVRRSCDVLTPEIVTEYRSKWKPSFLISHDREAGRHTEPSRRKAERRPRRQGFEATPNAGSTLLGSLTWRDYYDYLLERERRLSKLWREPDCLTKPQYGYFNTIREVSAILRDTPTDAVGEPEAMKILGHYAGAVSYAHLGSMMAARGVIAPFRADRHGMRTKLLRICQDRRLWNDIESAAEGVRQLRRIPGCGVGIATRVGAIMRPDLLVSLNGASEDQLCRWTGIPVNRLKSDDCHAYEAAMRFVASSRWYTSKRPRGGVKEQTCWDYRAALLDLFLYKPKDQTRLDELVDELLSPAEEL